MKPIHRLSCCAMVAAGLAVTSGCLKLKPVEDPTRYYILSAPAPPADSVRSTNSSLGLGLRPVSLPGYLREDRLAIRREQHQIEYLEWARWAEPLETGVSRVLAGNLAELLQSDQIRSRDWSRGQVQFELGIQIERFESDGAGLVTLEVSWRVEEPGNRQPLRSGRSRFTEQSVSNEPNATVAAMSSVLAEFSETVAALVSELAEHQNHSWRTPASKHGLAQARRVVPQVRDDLQGVNF